MTRSDGVNRKFVLAKRPKGAPDDTALRLETENIVTPGKGQMLLRNEYLSLDPYMRGRMSDAPSYAAPVEIGAVMVGGTVAQVPTWAVSRQATGCRRSAAGRTLPCPTAPVFGKRVVKLNA